MDEANSKPQEPAGGSPSDSSPATGAPPPAPDTAARVRKGIAALRGGNRAGAQAIFRSIADTEPRNENAWIGLALSADTAAEAAAAFHTAEEINPGSRFVAQAETDLRNRRPGFADALAAARAGTLALAEEPPAVIAPAEEPAARADEAAAPTAVVPVPVEATPVAEEPPAAPLAPPPPETPLLAATPRLASGAPVAAQGGSDIRRTLLSAGVVLLGAALIVLLGLALSSGGILQRPTPPTATTVAVLPSATAVPQAANPPTATEALPPGSPVVNVPPTLPASAVAAGPTNTGPQAAATLAATLGPDAVAQQTALAAVRTGQYATAIPTLEIASERSPGDSETLYYLGVAYLSAPDRPTGAQDAELTFRSLLAQRPDWPPALDMLARSLIAQGRYADAVPFAYKAVQLEPARPEYFITLGRAYEGGGDTADAQKAYSAAVRLSGTPLPGVTATAPTTGTLTLPGTIGAGTPVTGTATIVVTGTAGLPATAGLTATAGLPSLPVITQSPGITVTVGSILIPVAGTPALDTPTPAATTVPGTTTALPATVPASPATSGTAAP